MTQEQLKEYESLGDAKYLYNMGMRNHPEWSHEQAFTYAVIVKGGIPPLRPIDEPHTPNDIFKAMLSKAKDFIENDFPRIYNKVKDAFEKAMDWIRNAVTVTLDGIFKFFGL